MYLLKRARLQAYIRYTRFQFQFFHLLFQFFILDTYCPKSKNEQVHNSEYDSQKVSKPSLFIEKE